MNSKSENGSGRAGASPEALHEKLQRAERWLFGPAKRGRTDTAVGLAVVIALALLLVHYYRGNIPTWPAGEAATADVKAPADLTVINQPETEARRQRAAAEVRPVYDYDPAVLAAALANLKAGFASARSVLDEAGPPQAAGPAEQLHGRVERSTGWLLSETQFKTLLNRRFSPELEEFATKNLQTAMTGGVLANREASQEAAFNGLTLRDPAGAETAVSDASAVRDVVAARSWLRSGAALWPGDYAQPERTHLGEWLGSYVLPNLTLNKAETQQRQRRARANEPEAKTFIPRGEFIVRRGQIVTELRAAQLAAARSGSKLRDNGLQLLGNLLLVGPLMLMLWRYLSRRHRSAQLEPRPLFLLLAILFAITLVPVQLLNLLAVFMGNLTAAPFGAPVAYQYLAPVALGAALAVLLTDVTLGFIFAGLLAVFVGLTSGSAASAAYTLASGLAAVQYLRGVQSRSAVLRAGFFLGLLNMTAALALDLAGANMVRLNYVGFDLACAFASGVLSAVLASSALPVFESAFKVTTDVRLIELGNLDLPLLRRLASEAPGTYHHSILVGMLAEAAAAAVGANALLARVASYYHDIGKIKMPEYFAENFTYLADKHDAIKPKISSIVIANHVREGLELARREKLPPQLRSVIAQHHGTALMTHFYQKAMQETEPRFAEAMENEFRYNGPKPQTREAAIVMIADAVEVASRAVTEPTPARLQGLVADIIKAFRDDEQFEQCDLTMSELHTVGESFLRVLTGIYHHRLNQAAGYIKASGQHASKG